MGNNSVPVRIRNNIISLEKKKKCQKEIGLSYKFLVSNPHERRVEEFYKTYDPVKSLQRMNEAGLMESAQ
ncbi:hypothetical protein ANTPLA_LOCUS885 [Anthophora plagiata]